MRQRQRGFSLVELLVSVAAGSFLVAAAVSVSTQNARILGRTTNRVDRAQAARLTMDLLAHDLRMAGVGVGYGPDGNFGGLARGDFTVSGGARFFADDHALTLATGTVVTDDLGIRQATGRVRTIASYASGTGEVCAGSGLSAGDLAIVMTREGMHARTVRIDDLAASACTDGVCLQGCERFQWQSDPTYLSDPHAVDASYVDGEIIADFSETVWFVEPGPDEEGLLRRAEIDANRPCAARDETCGGIVAFGVETLQVAVWQWDSTNEVWADRTTMSGVTDRDRIRVDIELVVRGSDGQRVRGQAPVELQLAQQCLPAPCGTEPDGIDRRVLRSSVEIRNAGRMQLR